MREFKLPVAAGALLALLAATTPLTAQAQQTDHEGGTGGAAGHAFPNSSDSMGGAAPSADSYGAPPPDPMNAPPLTQDRAATPSPIELPPTPDKDPDRKE